MSLFFEGEKLKYISGAKNDGGVPRPSGGFLVKKDWPKSVMRMFPSEFRLMFEKLTAWTTFLGACGEYEPSDSFSEAVLTGPRCSYI